MIPIYEQGKGEGIGYGFDEFLNRFDQICAEHLRTRRAKAFAFIFYDFRNEDLREILKQQGVFAQLDRLARDEMSVFYLHTSSTRKTVTSFNREFLSKLNVHAARPPCVVFFKLRGNEVGDVMVAQLNSANLLNGFHELYEAIATYIGHDVASVPTESRYLKWLKGSGTFIAKEVFESTIKMLLEIVKTSMTGG